MARRLPREEKSMKREIPIEGPDRGPLRTAPSGPVLVRLRAGRTRIDRLYENASIANDFLIAIWFLVGSVLFLLPTWNGTAAWLFVVGSAQFLARPAIRIAHRFHVRTPQDRWESRRR